MQDQDTARAEAVHETYEHQVAATNATMVEDLWGMITAAAAHAGDGGSQVRVTREERGLILSDAASGRTLRFEFDEVLDLPGRERPGPFGMGNARVTVTAWEGVPRTWLLRNVAAGGTEYRWVTLPGDVVVDNAIISTMVRGLVRGELPPDPAETVHIDTTAPESATLATGAHWALYNLYSGERRPQRFASGAEAGDALKELVRAGEISEGDWEARPLEEEGR